MPAEAVRDLPRDINKIYAEDGLRNDSLILAKRWLKKIEELLTTGTLEFYERLATEVPYDPR